MIKTIRQALTSATGLEVKPFDTNTIKECKSKTKKKKEDENTKTKKKLK